MSAANERLAPQPGEFLLSIFVLTYSFCPAFLLAFRMAALVRVRIAAAAQHTDRYAEGRA